jgi:hypothetical protein
MINDMYDNDMRGNRVFYVLHIMLLVSLMTLVANNNHDVQ